MKLLFASLLCFFFSLQKDYPLLNNSVPEFSGKTIKNKNIDHQYFKGKVTLINFMALGCKPCMKELPFLTELQNELPKERFQVLCIAPHSREHLVDFNSDANTSYARFRKSTNVEQINFDLLPECEISLKSATDDKYHLTLLHDCDSISVLFNVDAYPMTFLVDPNGIIRETEFGYPMEVSDSTYKNDLRKKINALLK